MALSPQKFREVVLQLLFAQDYEKTAVEESAMLLRKELGLSKTVAVEATDRVQRLLEEVEALDCQIAEASNAYDWVRIPMVERNVLRLGLYELTLDEDIPPKVAISEAMRLARKFSTPEAATFINAVLDHLYKRQLGEEDTASDVSETFDQFVASTDAAREVGEQEAHDEEV